MKMPTTQKYIRNMYDNSILSVGYCAAWHLLRGVEPFAYNAGVYGWNCDYYATDNACICTGYRPHGKTTHAITREYEQKARKIWENSKYKYDTKIRKIATLRSEWIYTALNS